MRKLLVFLFLSITSSAFCAGELHHADVGAEMTRAEYTGIAGHVLDGGQTGDLIYQSGSGNLVRLPIGSTAQLIRVVGGVPAWWTADYLTTAGLATAHVAEADVCTTATFAVLAATAQVANTATTATYATGSGTAYLAYNADNATTASYAATAGTAAHATSADNSTTATHATTSTYATSAGSATSAATANTCTTATFASNATTATYALNAGGVSALSELSDVALTSQTAGQLLGWDGTGWTNLAATWHISGTAPNPESIIESDFYYNPTLSLLYRGTTSLGYLLPSTVDNAGKYLTNDGDAISWGTVSPGATALSALTDVSLTSQTTGQGVGWNGSTWTNMTLAGEKGDTGATGPAGVPLPDYTGKAKWFLKVADDETTVTWTNELYTSATVSAGPTSSFTDFPLAKSIFSEGNTGHTYTGPIGVVGEANATTNNTGTGVGGVATTNGVNQGRGVSGVGKVQATGDTGAAIGIYGRSEDTHSGGRNIGLYGAAVNGATNYALWMSTGNIYSAAAQTWTLVSSVNALNIQSGLFNIDTTNNRVGINNMAPAYAMDVTGDINCTGSVRVNGTALGSGGGSTTCYTSSGTLANGASVTITHAADGYPSYKRNAQIFTRTYPETLLLHMDTLAFPDETGKTITNNGVTTSTTQSKFGGVSAYFSSAANYLSVAGTTGVSNFGTGDFTVDFWIYPTTINSSNTFFYQGSGAPNFLISYGSGTLALYGASGAPVVSGSCSITANNGWYHIAAIGSGTSRKLFLNGTVVASATNSTSIGDATNTMYCGNFGSSQGMVGYYDEVRFVKGAAKWTANFTPETSPYSLSYICTQVVVTVAYLTSTTTQFTNSTGSTINYLALVQLLP